MIHHVDEDQPDRSHTVGHLLSSQTPLRHIRTPDAVLQWLFFDGEAAPRSLTGRRGAGSGSAWPGQVCLVEPADIGAGRTDLVDLVEDLVGERDVDVNEQVPRGIGRP
ncbi:hypothetical protein [Micromonospora marina]|uniref:hypothetical protein n=1 Tax=Micromonospora marina TaxID=307120 RepID=UPI00366EFBF9